MDIEAAVMRHLREHVDCGVYAVAPSPEPARFITVERTGGATDNVIIDRPTLAIQCWATSVQEASELAWEVDKLIPSLRSIDGIRWASRNSLYRFPAEDNKPRYQIVVEIVSIK